VKGVLFPISNKSLLRLGAILVCLLFIVAPLSYLVSPVCAVHDQDGSANNAISAISKDVHAHRGHSFGNLARNVHRSYNCDRGWQNAHRLYHA